MTEAEWLACPSPIPMLLAVQSKRMRRKVRLFACACCRRLWARLPEECREGIAESEAFADVLSSGAKLGAAHARVNSLVLQLSSDVWRGQFLLRHPFVAAAGCCDRTAATTPGAVEVATLVADVLVSDAAGDLDDARTLELAAQADLVREVFGNPFWSGLFSPQWRTDTAIALARTMYEARDFSAMPILADALQDAGCDNDDVLNHCRGGSVHVRGCWVIDGVLGRG